MSAFTFLPFWFSGHSKCIFCSEFWNSNWGTATGVFLWGLTFYRIGQRQILSAANNYPTTNYTGLIPATLLKKRLWRRCFSVNFVKFMYVCVYVYMHLYVSIETSKMQNLFKIQQYENLCITDGREKPNKNLLLFYMHQVPSRNFTY